MTLTIAMFFSTRVRLSAPLLKASIPTAPVPANKSRKFAPRMRGAIILNSDSRTLSVVGLVFSCCFFGGPLIVLPLCFPPTIRMISIHSSQNWTLQLIPNDPNGARTCVGADNRSHVKSLYRFGFGKNRSQFGFDHPLLPLRLPELYPSTVSVRCVDHLVHDVLYKAFDSLLSAANFLHT